MGLMLQSVSFSPFSYIHPFHHSKRTHVIKSDDFTQMLYFLQNLKNALTLTDNMLHFAHRSYICDRNGAAPLAITTIAI